MDSFNNYTGLKTTSSQSLVLDAGMFVIGINEDELKATGIAAALSTTWLWNGVTVTPTPLGLTRGGASFDPQKEERQIEFNGKRVPIMGFDRVDMFTPVLSVTLLELADFGTLKLGLGQATENLEASDYYSVTPNIDITTSDYIPNVALIRS